MSPLADRDNILRVNQPTILKDLKFLLCLVVANTFAHSDRLCFDGRCGRSGLRVRGSRIRVVPFAGGGLRILPPLGAVDKNALALVCNEWELPEDIAAAISTQNEPESELRPDPVFFCERSFWGDR